MSIYASVRVTSSTRAYPRHTLRTTSLKTFTQLRFEEFSSDTETNFELRLTFFILSCDLSRVIINLLSYRVIYLVWLLIFFQNFNIFINKIF